jgi:hypothetical protein
MLEDAGARCPIHTRLYVQHQYSLHRFLSREKPPNWIRPTRLFWLYVGNDQLRSDPRFADTSRCTPSEAATQIARTF